MTDDAPEGVTPTPAAPASAASPQPAAPVGGGMSLEDARMAYQTAVSLWIFEGTLLWSKYNAMLVANSIVLAATGFAADSALPAVFRKGLPVVGILLCVLWFQLTARGMDYHTYWILSARELEEMYLPKGVTTVSRGGPFADGKLVSLTIDGHSVQVRMGRVGRLSKTAWSSNLTVVCFLVLYVFLLV